MIVGLTTTIRPAYNSETGERDIYDEIAECRCVVLEVRPDDYAVVRLNDGEETVVHLGRLRPPRLE